MKVLAIVGTYRKGGNTDTIIDQIVDGAASKGAEVEKIYVDDLNFSSCQGCLDCRKEGICKQEDDVAMVVRKLNEADGLIIGSPVYGNYMTGQLKLLLDRLMGVISQVQYVPGDGLKSISRLEKKKRQMVMVLPAGAPFPECADDALKLLRRMLGTHANGGMMEEIVATSVNAYGAITMSVDELEKILAGYRMPNPREAAMKAKEKNEALLEKAYDVGVQMVETL